MRAAVIELRQYTLKPHRRDAFIALFEREFVETQEAVGIRLIGLFRDLDDPDRFVWLRGFPDMAARKLALETFYFGPVWAEHRMAANAEIVDSDDVLLLAPAAAEFPQVDSLDGSQNGVILVGVHRPTEPFPHADLNRDIGPALTAAGLRPLGVLATETAENSFPRLPVRTDGPVLVWFAAADDAAAADLALDGLDVSDRAGPRLQTLRLAPTPRSRLRGRPLTDDARPSHA